MEYVVTRVQEASLALKALPVHKALVELRVTVHKVQLAYQVARVLQA